jgi:hypothetical protein
MNQTLRSILWVGMLALPFAACGGGSSGTGITTAEGNVGSAVASLRATPKQPGSLLAQLLRWRPVGAVAYARSPVEDIRVGIEGTGIETRTDGAGAFVLRGAFAGPVGMIFELPDSEATLRLVITVPHGGNLTLNNVRIDARKGQVSVDLQSVRFAGVVEASDCSHSVVTLVSAQTPGDGNLYTVDLAAAALQGGAGAPLACASLVHGRSVEVDGDVLADGHVAAHTVEVKAEQLGGGNFQGGQANGSESGEGNGGGSTSSGADHGNGTGAEQGNENGNSNGNGAEQGNGNGNRNENGTANGAEHGKGIGIGGSSSSEGNGGGGPDQG